MDYIKIKSVGKDFVDAGEYVLEDTPRTRIVFKAQMHSGGVRGDLIRYRKDSNGSAQEIVPVNFNSLHPNEGIKITLSTDVIKILHKTFEELELLLNEKGIHAGTRKYAVLDPSDLIIDDRNKMEIIQKLLESDYSEDIWSQLVVSNPDTATKFANARLQENREAALKDFDLMLNDDQLLEEDWQNFFENNTWIFGYGLRYQILRIIKGQANYGGMNYSGRGQQRGDFLTSTEAETKFTCLVERKKPTTDLLQKKEYRNGAISISAELAGAIAQVQANCAHWEITDARTEENLEAMKNVYTVSPKGIVVVGSTAELDTFVKRNSFERFRRELRNPEIITFDELFERAKYIVNGFQTDY